MNSHDDDKFQPAKSLGGAIASETNLPPPSWIVRYVTRGSVCFTIAMLVSSCTSHRAAVARSASSDQLAAPSTDQATRAWNRLSRTFRGSWVATTSTGSRITETFRLISNDTVLVEAFVTPSGRETMSVYHLDHGALMLTHYCSQGNQPRLRAALIGDDSIVFRFLDATNVLDGEAVLVEKMLHFRDAQFEQTEVYRQPDGSLQNTVFRFSPMLPTP